MKLTDSQRIHELMHVNLLFVITHDKLKTDHMVIINNVDDYYTYIQ